MLATYLGAMVGVGVYFARKNKNTDEYFRGGQSIPVGGRVQHLRDDAQFADVHRNSVQGVRPGLGLLRWAT